MSIAFSRMMGRRSPADFSREFAGYMAKAAEDVMEAWIVSPETHDDDDRRDAFKALSSAVYEWRKREARAQSSVTTPARSAEDNAG